MSYDDWKTDAPPMVSGHGTAPYALKCAECAWRIVGKGLRGIEDALAAGDAHHAETGHAITERHGVVQARWTRRAVAVSR